MTPANLCRSLLRVVDSIPSTIPYGATEISDILVFVHDRRDEATTPIMEAVAGQFGDVVSVESMPSARGDAGPLLGCLIRVTQNADEVAATIRTAYAIATTEENDSDSGPF